MDAVLEQPGGHCAGGSGQDAAQRGGGQQKKLIKFNTLLANLVIFHNALDIMDVVRGLAAEGWTTTAAELGAPHSVRRALFVASVASCCHG